MRIQSFFFSAFNQKKYPLRGCYFEWVPLLQAPKPAGALHAKSVSPVATGDEGRRPSTLQTFEKV